MKSKKAAKPTRMVRIDKAIVDKVERNKVKTGVLVGKFFAMAAEEKLKSQNS